MLLKRWEFWSDNVLRNNSTETATKFLTYFCQIFQQQKLINQVQNFELSSIYHEVASK